LANSAVVYSREINDGVLTFAPSGWTYGEEFFESTFVLIDKETESLWFPMTDGDCCVLVAISGFFTDTTVKGIQRMERSSWSDWATRNPATKFVRDRI